MRLIRSAGQNVSPSDDGRLYDQIFADGLFEDATFANLGQNNVAVSEIYGIICGRDFTCEAQTIQVTLPEEESTVTGYIYLEVNTAAENVFTINSALAPFTPTYEDINVNGTICQMVLATYTATQLQIESITPQYVLASAGAVGSLASIESSPVKNNHSKNTFLVYNGILYKARTAIAAGEDLVVGTNISRAYVGTELTSLNNGLTTQADKITQLCEDHRSSTSVLTYCESDNCPSGLSFYATASGTTGNPVTTGSFFFIILRYGSGKTVIGMGVGNYTLYLNRYLISGGVGTWGGWRTITATA